MKIVKRFMSPNLFGKFSIVATVAWITVLICNVHTLQIASRDALNTKVSVADCHLTSVAKPEPSMTVGASILNGVCAVKVGTVAFVKYFWNKDKLTGLALSVAMYDLISRIAFGYRIIKHITMHVYRCIRFRYLALKRMWAKRKRKAASK